MSQRREIKRLPSAVSTFIRDWDPLDLGDGTSDEYDCLAPQLTSLLVRDATAEELASFLVVELRDHHECEIDRGFVRLFARDLVNWHARKS